MAAECAKCGQRLDEGLTRCPGCGESLSRPGAFTEILGWVLAVVSSIPLIIGEKTLEQKEYVPLITGGVMLVLGIVLVIVGRMSSAGTEPSVRERDAEATPGTP